MTKEDKSRKETSCETKGRETEEYETNRCEFQEGETNGHVTEGGETKGVSRATQTSLPRQPHTGTWASMGTSS